MDDLRPGWLGQVPLRALAHEGGKESGMQPQGQGAWCVAEAIRETIKSERGKTEGLIGTLKTDQDGVQQTPGTSVETLEMAGPRSLLSCNLNKPRRDSGQANQ